MSTRMLYIREKLKRCSEFVNEYNEGIVFQNDKLSFYKMAISGDVIPLPIGITMSDMALYFEVANSITLQNHFFPQSEDIMLDFIKMTYEPLSFNHNRITIGPECVFSVVQLAKIYNVEIDSVIQQLEKHGFILANS